MSKQKIAHCYPWQASALNECGRDVVAKCGFVAKAGKRLYLPKKGEKHKRCSDCERLAGKAAA